ncbi:MAG: RnfABCDGE type electron transport complex subunit D [Actinomycetes bacterium]
MPDRTAPAVVARRVPPLRDPRWGQAAVLALFTVLGQTTLHFRVSVLDVLLALASACGLELVLHWQRHGQVALPLSAVISGLSIGLLLRSSYPAVFVACGLVAIGSKYLIAPGGRHLFNPSNFGLVVVLALSQGITDVTPGQWGTSAGLLLVACAAGALIVFRVRKLVLVGAFLGAHLLAVVAQQGGNPAWGHTFNASILIFTFFRLTDPKTSPVTRRGQVAYAVLVAALTQVFVAGGSMVGPFVALTLVCAAVPVLDRLHGPPRWLAAVRRRRPEGGPAPAA